ncbi:membrane protein FAM174-like [Polyodon spathula]|uniref:membrane protein FAM174-like n=1 Tax=Polyodon spathula TaxID=7913 RepID=UPI001B7E31B1|nr:membrane protein FAM174-like [Polyodon spathula]
MPFSLHVSALAPSRNAGDKSEKRIEEVSHQFIAEISQNESAISGLNMHMSGALVLLWVVLCAAVVGEGEDQTGGVTTKKTGNESLGHGDNATESTGSGGYFPNVDNSMIRRAFCVLIGITATGVLYFIIRAVRLKKAPKKKYGLLSSYDDTVEIKHLEESDEDGDTVYEARSLRR